MQRATIKRRHWWQHPWLRHLRLPFNLLLSPIYLWGVLLAGGSLRSWDFWLGYASLHIFLYGGTTAFNSYYDRDEGPVGGMLEPPPVDRGLLGFSLCFQALGALLTLLVGVHFSLAWLLLFLIFSAYSHPLIRLKANAFSAMSAIALGQGAVGFALGWLLVTPSFASLLSPLALWGMLSTALIVSGLYIVTQSYQTAEDRLRGDHTFAVLLGAKRALYIALLILISGGMIMLAVVVSRFAWGWTLALSLLFVLIGTALFRWAQHFDEREVRRNFYAAMRLTTLSSGLLSLFLLYHLWQGS